MIVRSVPQMAGIGQRLKRSGTRVGFVPTMGALHDGHASLIRRSLKEMDKTVVSIFVNPAQFAPGEDLAKYPRVFPQDAALCRKLGVEYLFCPTAEGMYPQGYGTFLEVEGVSAVLCGKYRPGHFRGVATVVAKLFNIVAPAAAYFGRKDAQQAYIVTQAARDLNFSLSVRICPTVREADGLAMSSRNRYLSPQERIRASALYQALRHAKYLVRAGVRDAATVKRQMCSLLRRVPGLRVQYAQLVDPRTFLPVRDIDAPCLALLAAYVGKTRLIDNMEIA